MMKIAVAGSTGVLGRAIIPLLLQQGYEVRALARSVEKAKNVFPQNVEIAECDFLSPNVNEKIGSYFQGCGAVIHVATSIPKKDRKSTRLNSSHGYISYAVFCLK